MLAHAIALWSGMRTTVVRKAGPAHYNDVIMGAMVSQITSLTIVYSTVYSGADQRKYQTSVSLALVRGIHRRPVNSPHKWPATWKMFPFDDVIMNKIQKFLNRIRGQTDWLGSFLISCTIDETAWQGSWGQHGAHLGPTGPRWAPCWPHELFYLVLLWQQLNYFPMTTLKTIKWWVER